MANKSKIEGSKKKVKLKIKVGLKSVCVCVFDCKLHSNGPFQAIGKLFCQGNVNQMLYEKSEAHYVS